MKFTFLGTAAAEGFPAVFCNCQFCKEARALGGKNIRTRSQSIVNDDLLIDLPADTNHHFLMNGIEGHKIKYLFVTHPHQDHFYPDELSMRYGCFAHDMAAPVLQLFCSRETADRLGDTPQNVSVTVMEAFQTVVLPEYSVTALPARHIPGAFFYIIQGEKTILYGHDTGYFYEEVFEFLEKKGFRFDMVTLDCTNVDIPIPDTGGHMGFPNIQRVLQRLTELGAISDRTVKYVNHYSHNANPLQQLLETRAAEFGCLAAYDGCQVEL